MKTSDKLLALSLEVENLCEGIGYDFNENFDHQFSEIRMEIKDLESRTSRVEPTLEEPTQ